MKRITANSKIWNKRHRANSTTSFIENIGRLPRKPNPQQEKQQQIKEYAQQNPLLHQRIFLSELLSYIP